MKCILLMQLVHGYGCGGGVSIDSQYFSTESQCEVVARVFLNDHDIELGRVERKATCIKLK